MNISRKINGILKFTIFSRHNPETASERGLIIVGMTMSSKNGTVKHSIFLRELTDKGRALIKNCIFFFNYFAQTAAKRLSCKCLFISLYIV